MSPIAASSARVANRSRSSVWLLVLSVALLCARSDGRAQSANPLKFFDNYFVTGDYVVAGVGLRGLGGLNGSPAGIARGTITVSGVPTDGDVVAAFLYWQVVSTTALGPDSGAVAATFDGTLLSSADGPFSKVLNRDGTAPCWSSGGGTGSSGGTRRTFTYRADVRRFFPVDAESGRLIVNGPHEVRVPDAGSSGNGLPIALGASLLVVYRDNRVDPRAPLKSIVVYDGGYTMDQSNESMSQTLGGFYQTAAAPTTAARLTHIVGSGQANKSERLLLPGVNPILGPFAGVAGDSWDSPTYNVGVLAGSSTITTSVDHVGFSTFDCLSWGAIVFSTEVQDTDGDGLLDIWETNTWGNKNWKTNTGLKDPNGRPLPNLADMGADLNVKDVFVEIGYMEADDHDGTADSVLYGGVPKPEHRHLPDPTALKMVGDAFASQGIAVHFDVGSNYQALEAGTYVIPSARARGGEAINEFVTACPWPDCQFGSYPGTVGWKVGYKFFRDQLLRTPTSTPPLPPLAADGSDPCDVPGVAPGSDDGPGGACERRFDRNRKDMFRYVLAAHFVGLPKSEFPCLDSAAVDAAGNPVGTPVPASTEAPFGICAVVDNPSFHIPRTSSGVGDFPGADTMLTLGGFSDAAGRPVGTPFMQGSTLMHELGHTFDLSHSGVYVPTVQLEPCKPNYLSSMNYLFQLRGLFNDSGNPGPHMDYSGEVLGGLSEAPPVDGAVIGGSYRTGWYAPEGPLTIGSPATKHCDGSPLTAAEETARLEGQGMVRVDSPSVGSPIDWNLDPSPSLAQDINFDGTKDALSAGSDDWFNLRLNQIGTRRNVLGLSVDLGRDGLGRDGLGRDGLGRDGLGRDGLGRDGLGRDGLGRDGLGRDGLGRDGLGRDGLGRDGLGRDGLGRDGLGVDETDDIIAAAGGYAPATGVTGTVLGGSACAGLTPALCHRIQLTFEFPTVFGEHLRFVAFRSPALGSVLPFGPSATDPPLSITDLAELPNGTVTYVVAADSDTLTPPLTVVRSPAIPFTITAINVAPVAVNDVYTVAQGGSLSVATSCAVGKGVLCNDSDIDSASLKAALVAGRGPTHAATFALNADGSFTYTPAPSFAGTDSFTYTADDVDPTNAREATVTITVNDNTPPVVTLTVPAPNAQGWYTTKPVAVTVSAADPLNVTSISCTVGVNGTSVIVMPALTGGGTTLASGTVNLTAEGTHSVSCSATDGAGNTGAAAGSSPMPATVRIDTQKPTLTITAPANNATLLLRASVNASFSCSDGTAPPASGMKSCTGTVATGAKINTATVGPKTFAVTATDVAGNTTTVTNAYTVVYAVTLLPVKGPATQGSAVPVTWELKDALGASVTSLSSLLTMESVFNGPMPSGGCVASTTGTRETLYSPANGSTGKSSFRYVPPYQFNWDTTTTATAPTITGKGCYTVLIYLDDGSTPKMTTPVQLK